jgi:hypothetical protein
MCIIIVYVSEHYVAGHPTPGYVSAGTYQVSRVGGLAVGDVLVDNGFEIADDV